MTCTAPAVFDPVVTVIVVLVVLTIFAVRTKTARRCAIGVPPSSYVMAVPPIRSYVPDPLLSAHVGAFCELAATAQMTTSKSPTAGVIATVRLLVPDVDPPAALVRYVAAIAC